MKKLIMKLLGLDTLVSDLTLLKKQNEELKTKIENLENVVEEIEIPDIDADDFVREDDVNDRIESYLNDNEYVSSSYVDDEIESKVSDKVEEAIEDLDIDEKVRDLFNDASPAPMSEEDIKKEVAEAVKVTLEKMVKALADQQD
jgi:hypothetical protein